MSDSQPMTWACPSCDATGNNPTHRPDCKRPNYPADINTPEEIGSLTGPAFDALMEDLICGVR